MGVGKKTLDQISVQGLQSLLYQVLETELSRVRVYASALTCAQNSHLRDEWEKCLRESERHAEIAYEMLSDLGLKPDAEHPARKVARHMAASLVGNMEMALQIGERAVAELTACECVSYVETKDHLNWEILEVVVQRTASAMNRTIVRAREAMAKQEDSQLRQSARSWRELWTKYLGVGPYSPPSEIEEGDDAANPPETIVRPS